MATIIYARVSKADQNLAHQEDNLWKYATDNLGVDGDDIDVLSDKSTGTDTDRSGYREMLARVRDADADRVIVREITRLGRTMREISENVHEIVQDHGVGLHVMNDQLEVEPGDELTMRDKMLLNVLAWSAELEAKKIQENTRAGLRAAEAAGKWVGRPPYGFSTDDDGYLQPTENFSKAREAIIAVEEKGWSDRKAARHSGVPRRTVPNVVDRKDLYLEEHEPPEN
ncbi:recombinase family protein [Halorubrum tropicale]|uniref:Resolvase n=1 Tax=Halorubrum tropicale TaxID=1765655 RepID=A0A0N0U9D3_9EURY|nr:recombinase family protein [Halorubrum tropicale]KOX93253.1 resolvase [Halorubrum tropicale]